MALIVQTGYEAAVRSKLGVKESELPDSEINQRLILDLAEAVVVKRVPNYASISDVADLIRLEAAVVSYVCYLLSRGMARRVNIQVQTIDVKWVKDKVDWTAMGEVYLAEMEQLLSEITSVEVDYGADSAILAIIKGPSGSDATGGATG
jgi:hypothetical protein